MDEKNKRSWRGMSSLRPYASHGVRQDLDNVEGTLYLYTAI